MSPSPRSPSCSQGLSASSNERSTAMVTVLPTWAAEAAVNQWPRYSYAAPATGFSSAWAPSLGQVGQVSPFAGLPCGTCGPCLPDETSATGCSKSCWTRSPPGGTCDQYDIQCRAPGCRPTCPPGEILCGTTCVNITDDPNHCGTCTNACASGSPCCNGVCCSPGSTCCNGGCGGNLCPDGVHCCGPGQGTCSGDNRCCCPFPSRTCLSTPLGMICIP
jgi:hypothetical protein